MNDNLDQLSDHELSEVFAVEVAGDEPEQLAFASRDGGQSGALFEDSRFSNGGSCRREDVKEFCQRNPEFSVHFRKHFRNSYATSADAVLPFLESEDEFPEITRPCMADGNNTKRVWQITMDGGYATSDTFARASSIALIRAKRGGK